MAKKTLEEKLILKLLEIAKSSGDPFSEVNIETVTGKIGVTQRQSDNIIKILKRTGFVKQNEGVICLTSKGIELGEELSS